MKKITKIFSFIMCSIAVLNLVACGFSESDATYVEDAFSDVELASDAELIKDYGTLTDYISNMDMSEEMQDKLSAYEEDFFDKNMLVIICHWETSGSNFIKVEDVDYEGTWVEVDLDREVPEVRSDDMKSWGIVVEIKKDDNLTSASYTID